MKSYIFFIDTFGTHIYFVVLSKQLVFDLLDILDTCGLGTTNQDKLKKR